MSYSRTIHLADTDAAGVIYFASLLSICHEAYENHLTQSGIDLKSFFLNPETALPIVHAEIDFFHPLFCGDRLEILITSQLLNENSFEIHYQIFLTETPQHQVAKGKTKHVCINIPTRQKKSLPEAIKQVLLSN